MRQSTGSSRKEPLSEAEYRKAAVRLAVAACVVTSDGKAGRNGVLASAVASVTDQPPTLLACLPITETLHDTIMRNGVFCVSVLPADRETIADMFAAVDVTPGFAAGQWNRLVTGSPVLRDAIVAFDCRVVKDSRIGGCGVYFGEIDAISHGRAGAALVCVHNIYHHLGGVTVSQKTDGPDQHEGVEQ